MTAAEIAEKARALIAEGKALLEKAGKMPWRLSDWHNAPHGERFTSESPDTIEDARGERVVSFENMNPEDWLDKAEFFLWVSRNFSALLALAEKAQRMEGAINRLEELAGGDVKPSRSMLYEIVREARPGLCEGCPPAGYPTDKTRCEPCPRREIPAPDAPYPVGPENANNSKRTGWASFFAGKERHDCPYPTGRRDLQDGYREGWDAAKAALAPLPPAGEAVS